jgi:SAM-dependent methyltransferase
MGTIRPQREGSPIPSGVRGTGAIASPTMKSVPPYDAWAWVFDRYWAHDLFLEPLEKLALVSVGPPARILDLCCGTGHLAAQLSGRGYQVTGLDLSGNVLDIARERAPSCRFVQADARDFSFGAPFDLVVSTYDSLNHILELDGLRQVFGCVRRSLAPGAPFVFDLGTEEGFRTRWTEPHAVVEDDVVVVGVGEYDLGDRSAEYRITIFRREDCWERDDVSVKERVHRPEDVLELLAGEGFVGVTRTAATDLGMEESAERTFYRAYAG